MTEREAIKLAIQGWKKLAVDGRLRKNNIPEFRGLPYSCPLCEYAGNHPGVKDDTACLECPYTRKFAPGSIMACDQPSAPFHKWCGTLSVSAREKYAQEFVEQLESLLEPELEFHKVSAAGMWKFFERNHAMSGWRVFEVPDPEIPGSVIHAIGFPIPKGVLNLTVYAV